MMVLAMWWSSVRRARLRLPPHRLGAAVGHVAPRPQEYATYVLGGLPRNPFGRDFVSAGHRWTVELCRKDSDADGRTNGEELGDPFCTWTPGSTPQFDRGITHPGLSSAGAGCSGNTPATVCAGFAPPSGSTLHAHNFTVSGFAVPAGTSSQRSTQ